MRAFAFLAALVGTALAAPHTISTADLKLRRAVDKGYTIAKPGTVDDIVITAENTLNGTVDNSRRLSSQTRLVPVPGDLDLNIVNNFGENVNAYIQGKDTDGAVVFIGGDSTLHYPSAGGSGVPVAIDLPISIPLGALGETTVVNVPIALESGRIYFCEGDLPFFIVSLENGGDGIVQPSVTNDQDVSVGLNWGFVEFTYTDELVVWANISFVDFVGMILSMALESLDGTVQEVIGLGATGAADVCNDLSAQSQADGMPWAASCVVSETTGEVLRVLSPHNLPPTEQEAFTDYWTAYVDETWAKYTAEPLTINTQIGNDTNVECQVVGEELQCAGDNRGYAKPTAWDIWGCDSGPFGKQEGDGDIHLAVIPRLCAGVVRSTMLVDGGNVQPSLPAESYYTVSPTNHYSRIVHAHEIDGKGYAFAYDDVNPTSSEEASGLVNSPNPAHLTFYVGGK